ncbi:MAG: hypothetical protein JWM31_2835 [Solirubrobacterales bacterium]|nr:hypothetical protein [Solirubrobacterales bacterium]
MQESPREHPEWLRRLAVARADSVPWVERHIPLTGRTILEYGCGQGAITCAFAARAARHIGVDIDPGEVALAQQAVARRGLSNVELRVWPVSEIVDRVREYRGEIDVLLLYAVLEHLTLEERLAVLRLGREIMRTDGHIVITETPNRLTPVDHHTARIPFLHALPLSVAGAYYGRSPRADFVDAIDAAAAGGVEARDEALERWGTGFSFHELEMAFGDVAAHTVASSYDAALYPSRPVRWEELQLAAVLDAWRPDLPPCWSRSWVDTILSVEPVRSGDEPLHVRPWPLRLPHDVAGASMLPDGRIELRPGARLPVGLPAPTSELHVGLMASDPRRALRVEVGARTVTMDAVDNREGIPPWHGVVRLSEPADRVTLTLPDGGCLTYVGFRGKADPAAPMQRPMGW